MRIDSPVPEQWIHGVVAPDRSEAVFAHVQFDETVHDPMPFVLAGLDPERSYTARQIVPAVATGAPPVEAPSAPWRGEGLRLSGAVLHAVGLPAPPREPITAHLVHLRAD